MTDDPIPPAAHTPAPSDWARRRPFRPGLLAAIAATTGREAEIQFLRLTITHYRARIAMAKAIQPLIERPEVIALAKAMATAQEAEIDQMQQMVAERGGA